VKRARGVWTDFKRGVTWATSWLPRFMGGISKQQQTERTLRRAEFRFDRFTNQLVEDLANNPDLKFESVARRLEKMAKEADTILSKDTNVSKEQLAQRFATNLRESLVAVARRNPRAMPQIKAAFKEGGLLDEAKYNYQIFSSDNSKEWRQVQSLRENQGTLTPWADVQSGYGKTPARPKEFELVQTLISKLDLKTGDLSGIEVQARVDEESHELQTAMNDIQKSMKGQASYKGSFRMDLKEPVSTRLKDLAENNPTTTVGDHEVAKSFLADASRATMKLTGLNGKIRREIEKEKFEEEQNSAKDELATKLLAEYASTFDVDPKYRGTVTKNLSRLMCQASIEALQSALTTSLARDGITLGVGDFSVEYNPTIDRNGDLIFNVNVHYEHNIASNAVPDERSPLGYRLDGSPRELVSSSSEISATWKVRKDDLSREPLKIEVLRSESNSTVEMK
jgi:hypothetical protein